MKNNNNRNQLTGENKIKNLTESFTYDNLNRLKSSHVAGQDAITLKYKDNGNISSKSDVGGEDYTYKYGEYNAGLHAVTSVTSDTHTPAPGKTTNSLLQQDITYTSFNKIATITQDENEMQFTYGTDNLRRKTQLYNNGNLIKTKYYVGNYEKEITGSSTRELHYIYGGDGLAAVLEKKGTSKTMYYVSKNYLGSPIMLTDEDGTITEQYNFDAWGNRRNPTTWSYTNVPTTYLLDRGFTFHEHMDEFGLINMNGRLYDPEIARMLSPDNNVQMPDFTQNFNRYSYCLNNPLKFTDPTGYTAYYAEDVLGRRDGSGGGINDAYSWGFWEPGDPHLSEIYGFDRGLSFENWITSTTIYDASWGDIFGFDVDGNGNTSFNIDNGESGANIVIDANMNVDRIWGDINIVDVGQADGGGLSNDGITLQEAGTVVGAFGAANGVKTNLVEWGMKGAEWGKAGAKYLKFVKRAGTVGFVVNVGISGYGSYDYYYNQNGTDWQVGAKATLDVAMGAAAFVWPIGTAISGAYFILDASTGGFGGWGDPYKP